MQVGYVYDPIYLEHQTGNHPENGVRLEAIMSHLDRVGLLAQMRAISAERATPQDLARIHSPELIARVRGLAESGGGTLISTPSWGRVPSRRPSTRRVGPSPPRGPC